MVQIKMKKPKAILFDISGTAAKQSFIDKVLLPYFKTHIKSYLEENWDKPQTQEDIERIRAEPGSNISAKNCPDKNAIIDSVVAYADKCTENKQEPKGYTYLRLHVWFDGYDRGRVETPVYSDVAIQLQKWRCDMQIQLYVLSNGWAEATRRFLAKTNHGDMNLLINEHFDTTIGAPNDPETFRYILRQIKRKPEEVLFLTKSPEESRAANAAGIECVLVMTHRRNIERLGESEKAMPRIRSFNELEFEQ